MLGLDVQLNPCPHLTIAFGGMLNLKSLVSLLRGEKVHKSMHFREILIFLEKVAYFKQMLGHLFLPMIQFQEFPDQVMIREESHVCKCIQNSSSTMSH